MFSCFINNNISYYVVYHYFNLKFVHLGVSINFLHLIGFLNDTFTVKYHLAGVNELGK